MTMNEQSPQNEGLPNDELNRQSTVTEEPDYEIFGAWMDGELEKLVARWIHLAAPNASRPFRRRFAP
jgi:hypothetical protein